MPSLPHSVHLSTFGTNVSTTALPGGSYLAAWTSANAAGDAFVHTAIFGADGSDLRPDSLLTSATYTSISSVQAVTLSDGRVAVVWSKSDGSGSVLQAQILDTEYNPVGTPFTVSHSNIANPGLVDIHATNAGGFAVLYSGSVEETSYLCVQELTPSGNLWDEQALVAHGFANDERIVTTILPNGRAIIVAAVDGSIGLLNAQDESEPSLDQVLATTNITTEVHPGVAALGDDKWVIVWADLDNGQPVFHAQVFTASATGAVPSGDPVVFSRPVGTVEGNPAIVPLDGGGFAFTFELNVNDQDDVYVAACRADGTIIHDTAPVGTTTNGAQYSPEIIALSNGIFAVNWINNEGQGARLQTEVFGTAGPSTPTDPSTPTNPGTPGTPDTPSTPDTPGTPSTPSTSTWNGTQNSDNHAGTAGMDFVYGLGGNDVLNGGVGNDYLYGGNGKDILTGGDGADIFVFDTKPHKTKNVDKITDFNVTHDAIWLDNKYFKVGSGTATSPKPMASKYFHKGKAAHDENDRLIYDKKKGVLYYDKDGTGSAAQVKIATFDTKPNLTIKDFFVI